MARLSLFYKSKLYLCANWNHKIWINVPLAGPQRRMKSHIPLFTFGLMSKKSAVGASARQLHTSRYKLDIKFCKVKPNAIFCYASF